MSIAFKIHDQGHDDSTIAARVENTSELENLAEYCIESDLAGVYTNLQEYLATANAAPSTPPYPYTRLVDIVWMNQIGYEQYKFFPDRILVVSYSGRMRVSGGYASQCYVVIDPNGFDILSGHVGEILDGVYVSNPKKDVLILQER